MSGNETWAAATPLVAKTLADAGYDCGLAGKFHLSGAQGRIEPRTDDGHRGRDWRHHAAADMPGQLFRESGLEAQRKLQAVNFQVLAGPQGFATMARSERFKQVVYRGHGLGELFDLEADPGEFDNLWDNLQLAQVRHERAAAAIMYDKRAMLRKLLILPLALSLAGIVAAQDRPRPRSLAPEWVSLFNGEDLSGWRKVGQERWEVVDGAILGQGVTDAYGYLVTEREYRDFHLALRFKCEADGNSGVYVHTAFEAGTPRVVAGRQIEIDRTIGHHTGGIYGDGKGWIAWPAPQHEAVIRPYDWNDMRIAVEGNRYVVHLNGVRVLDFTYPSPGAEKGSIALQLHSGGEGRMRFKDIFIRDLSGK